MVSPPPFQPGEVEANNQIVSLIVARKVKWDCDGKQRASLPGAVRQKPINITGNRHAAMPRRRAIGMERRKDFIRGRWLRFTANKAGTYIIAHGRT